MMIRHWAETKICDFCEEEFNPSRNDALFCSSKCRTANYRRERKRAEAAGLMEQWPDEPMQALVGLLDEWRQGEVEIVDFHIEHGDAAAQGAVLLAEKFMGRLTARLTKQLIGRDRRIERLEKETAVLAEIRRLLAK